MVCPVSLVTQWYDEACSKLTEMGKQTVYRYYGSTRKRDALEIAKYDIVVTTYAVLASDWRGKRRVNAKTGEFAAGCGVLVIDSFSWEEALRERDEQSAVALGFSLTMWYAPHGI